MSELFHKDITIFKSANKEAFVLNQQKIIIAIDGPAGSGKSSVSKEVAQNSGLKYIDSGAVYRSITLYFLEKYGKIENNFNFSKDIEKIDIKQVFNDDGTSTTYLNNIDVSEKIRNELVVKNIGIVSDDVAVRNKVNSLLRNWSETDSIIMDGRDIGTVVFPNADIKIYLDASVDVRALRRFKEYQEKGKNVDIKDIKNQIALRDRQDKSRSFGKLVRAEDAIYIDTTEMRKEEVIHKIVDIIRAINKSSFSDRDKKI